LTPAQANIDISTEVSSYLKRGGHVRIDHSPRDDVEITPCPIIPFLEERLAESKILWIFFLGTS
jgi:hypothetical protein